ncbi:MAG: fibrobacter succinogenes major paralogous domain-containing protein [Bacteroidia bacterium]|jgi:uncharacterized protein (TIGR02145 family)
MKSTLISIIISLAFSTLYSQSVTIGTQVWMAENLNVEKFRNGENIPLAKTQDEWLEAGLNEQPAWCYYNNDPVIGAKYGKLYNWYAVNDPRGLAPEGWSIPSKNDVLTLVNYLGGELNAGEKLKSTSGWSQVKGKNSIGFNALPGGWRDHLGIFVHVDYTGETEPVDSFGQHGDWWLTSESEENGECFYLLNADNTVYFDRSMKSCGFSVRTVKK